MHVFGKEPTLTSKPEAYVDHVVQFQLHLLEAAARRASEDWQRNKDYSQVRLARAAHRAQDAEKSRYRQAYDRGPQAVLSDVYWAEGSRGVRRGARRRGGEGRGSSARCWSGAGWQLSRGVTAAQGSRNDPCPWPIFRAPCDFSTMYA